ncbi:O-methyltransferase-domain-containing protein [Phyllosticta paracitricarpa]|uniref:O-methyltransferase-domain-containing protein n=1 Tax=Phyllosticta paracitricarpa TaxID=2016321 RepID=A0ABR1MTI0_9PEZI
MMEDQISTTFCLCPKLKVQFKNRSIMVAQAIPKPESLMVLANTIQSTAQTLTEYWKKNGLQQPSFDANSPPTLFPPGTDLAVIAVQHELLGAVEKLSALAHGPADYLQYYLMQFLEFSAFRYIQSYKIASFVPLPPPEAPLGSDIPTISYEDLAAKASAAGYPVVTADLKRMLRACISNMIFREPVPGHVAHTASSAQMIRSPEMQAMTSLAIEENFPAIEKALEAIEQFGPDAQEPWQTAYSIAQDTKGQDFYTYLTSQGPERVARFSLAMKWANENTGYGTQNVDDVFDWTSLGKGKFVDIGGSRGHNSIAIAKKAPDLTFVVQDLESVVKEANATIVPSLPSDLANRVSFQAYDFLKEEQPVKDADVYFFSMILHNWPDKYAAQILKKTVDAMKPGARIFILDSMVPEPGRIPLVQEKIIRCVDMAMKNLMNARERDLQDWEALFAQADPRLKLDKVIPLPGSILSLNCLSLES